MKRIVVPALAFIFALSLALARGEGEKRGPVKVNGVVKVVDAAKGSLTLAGRVGGEGGGTPDKEYTLEKGAKILIDGQAKGLADVKAGNSVTLTLTADKTKVAEVSMRTPGKGEGR